MDGKMFDKFFYGKKNELMSNKVLFINTIEVNTINV